MGINFHRISIDPAYGVQAHAWAIEHFGKGAEGLRWYSAGTAKFEGKTVIPVLWFYFANSAQAEWFALRWVANND